MVALVAGAATLTTHRPSGTTTPHVDDSDRAHQSHEVSKNHSHSSSPEKIEEQALRDDENDLVNRTAPKEAKLAPPAFELQAVKRDGDVRTEDAYDDGDEEQGDSEDLYSDTENDPRNLYEDDEHEELPVPMAQSGSKLP